MTSSQEHGFQVEQILLGEFERTITRRKIPQVALPLSYTAKFDVPPHRDPFGSGIGTSIKSAKYTGERTLVCMSDAKRICSYLGAPHVRLMVALYVQDGAEKEIFQIREYVISSDAWKTLMGGTPVSRVDDLAGSLRLDDHREARRVARAGKKKLMEEYPDCKVRWNPKIDSGSQRRLQCSVRLEDLEAVIRADPVGSRMSVFGTHPPKRLRAGSPRPMSSRLWISGRAIPFRVASPPRLRHVRDSGTGASAPDPVAVAAMPPGKKGNRP